MASTSVSYSWTEFPRMPRTLAGPLKMLKPSFLRWRAHSTLSVAMHRCIRVSLKSNSYSNKGVERSCKIRGLMRDGIPDGRCTTRSPEVRKVTWKRVGRYLGRLLPYAVSLFLECFSDLPLSPLNPPTFPGNAVNFLHPK